MADEVKRRGVRKATLTKSAASKLRQRIDLALLGEERRRLGSSAVEFLTSVRKQLDAPTVRLSKSQRDTTEEILVKAFSDAPVVFLEGDAMAELGRLFQYATGSGHISAFEENIIVSLRRRLDEPIIAISERLWRIVEAIKAKTYFGLPGEPPPPDPDGLVENDHPDCLPPEPDEETDVALVRQWGMLGIEDED
jgi:hypothetical protein